MERSLICTVQEFKVSSGKDVSESCMLKLLRPVDSRILKRVVCTRYMINIEIGYLTLVTSCFTVFSMAERLQVDELQFLSRWEGQRFQSVQAGLRCFYRWVLWRRRPRCGGCLFSSGGEGLQVGPGTTEYLQTGPAEAPTEAGALGGFLVFGRKVKSPERGVQCEIRICEDERIQSPCGR